MKQTLTIWMVITLLAISSCKMGSAHKEVATPANKEQVSTLPQKTAEKKDLECDSFIEELDKNYGNQSLVQPLGIYENISNTEDHSYGYKLELWAIEENVTGFFYLYEGSIEPDRAGPLFNGKLVNGNLHFTAFTKKSKGFQDWQKSSVHIFTFTGKNVNNEIQGGLSLYDCSKTSLDENYDKDVKLTPSDMYQLGGFSNIGEWKENYHDELDMNN